MWGEKKSWRSKWKILKSQKPFRATTCTAYGFSIPLFFLGIQETREVWGKLNGEDIEKYKTEGEKE